ncbi:hypothetical protein [Bacillus sp. AFS075034]|uniref:hypothetical protein n=1 Tax=Bacillus sp. AFS075034 TaxID=2034281 RepID=UPI0020D27118|nr:hypothetical protein [Bacillus sp. AFS075034]
MQMNELNVVEEKPVFPVRVGDLQFYAAKKKVEEEEEIEEIEEEEEKEEEPKPKQKKKEERPSWVDEILGVLKPQAETNNQKHKVPVPQVPVVEEEEKQEEQKAKKPSFLGWLW